jgi:peptidoglycan/LPS O-acetylase OafA/YrhL
LADRRVGRDALVSLTSLRWFAAALVVFYHLDRQVGVPSPVALLAWFGRSGVTFFFVLSGVVLAWTYAGRLPTLGVFWWRRLARIWPLHLVATGLSVLVYIAMGQPPTTRGVAFAIPLLHAWFPQPDIIRGGNGATWSLSDEAAFYLVFPFLLPAAVFWVRSLRRATIVGATATVLMGLAWWWSGLTLSPTYRSWFLDYFPPTRLCQFIVGVAFGTLLARGWRPRLGLLAPTLALLAVQAGLAWWGTLVPEPGTWSPYSASQLLTTPFFLWLILAAAGRDLRGSSGWLGNAWLVRLGHWSFAWYLSHEIVIRLFVHLVGRPATRGGIVSAWAVVLLVSTTLAWALYTWVEHPVEQRLRRLVPRRQRAGGLVTDSPS